MTDQERIVKLEAQVARLTEVVNQLVRTANNHIHTFDESGEFFTTTREVSEPMVDIRRTVFIDSV